MAAANQCVSHLTSFRSKRTSARAEAYILIGVMKAFFRNQWHAHRQRLAVIITAFFLIAGFVQAALGLSYVLKLTPVILAIIASIAVAFWDAPVKAKIRASAIIVIGSLIVEIIGVKTGLLFGDYEYGKVLGFTVLGAPLTIGLTWLLVSLSAWHIATINKYPLWQKFLLGGVLVVMFDLILEQFATAYGLWSWQGGTIPLYNYVCWFMVAQVWFFVFHKFAPKTEPSLYAVSALPLMAIFFWLMLAIA